MLVAREMALGAAGRRLEKLLADAKALLFEVCVGAHRRSELTVASSWVKKKETEIHLLFKRKCLFLEIILQGLVVVHLWQGMFNIRCCSFEIVLLW